MFVNDQPEQRGDREIFRLGLALQGRPLLSTEVNACEDQFLHA